MESKLECKFDIKNMGKDKARVPHAAGVTSRRQQCSLQTKYRLGSGWLAPMPTTYKSPGCTDS
jgi:hypothetical protein